MSDHQEGDRVLAQWDGGPFWFPGQVHSVAGDGSVAVRYDDGTGDIRPPNQVRRFDWAIGTAVDALWSGNNRWYAASILDVAPDGRMVLVEYDDDGSREARQTGQCRSR